MRMKQSERGKERLGKKRESIKENSKLLLYKDNDDGNKWKSLMNFSISFQIQFEFFNICTNNKLMKFV